MRTPMIVKMESDKLFIFNFNICIKLSSYKTIFIAFKLIELLIWNAFRQTKTIKCIRLRLPLPLFLLLLLWCAMPDENKCVCPKIMLCRWPIVLISSSSSFSHHLNEIERNKIKRQFESFSPDAKRPTG